jgi:hypothetical protein
MMSDDTDWIEKKVKKNELVMIVKIKRAWINSF